MANTTSTPNADERFTNRLKQYSSNLNAARDQAESPAQKRWIEHEQVHLQTLAEKLHSGSKLEELSVALSDHLEHLDHPPAEAELDVSSQLMERIAKTRRSLSELQQEIHQQIRLPHAELTEPQAAIEAEISPLEGLTEGITAPNFGGQHRTTDSRRFDVLRQEYDEMFRNLKVRPQYQKFVVQIANRITTRRKRYAAVCEGPRIPWYFVGILHGMEGASNFDTHLHNGDPLTARTKRVPKGRPPRGNPPFTWEESAADAIAYMELDKETDWSAARMLYNFERFNGFGYRPFRIPSPYLWSFSEYYSKGKYTEDGKFDRNAVSKQCGTALVLQHFMQSTPVA